MFKFSCKCPDHVLLLHAFHYCCRLYPNWKWIEGYRHNETSFYLTLHARFCFVFPPIALISMLPFPFLVPFLLLAAHFYLTVGYIVSRRKHHHKASTYISIFQHVCMLLFYKTESITFVWKTVEPKIFGMT